MNWIKFEFRDDIVIIADSLNYIELVPTKWRNPERFVPNNYFIIFYITDSYHPLYPNKKLRYWFWEKQRMTEPILFFLDSELGMTDEILQHLVMHEFNKLIP